MIKEEIKKLHFVYACWKSISGKGLSILASVGGMNSSNYIFFKKYLLQKYKSDKELMQGFDWDGNAFKLTQKTVLSRDEEIYVNEQCITLSYDEVYEFIYSDSNINNNKIRDNEKVQSTYLIEKKNSQGNYTAPHKGNYTAPSTCKEEINFDGLEFSQPRFNDKYKYAEADKPFTVYPDGVWTNEMYFPKDYIIKEGKRRNLLYYYACKFIRINGENYINAYNFVKWLRTAHCESPNTFLQEEIKEVVLSALSGYNSVKIKMKKRVVIFPEDTPYSGEERREISGKVMSEIKANQTVDLLTELYKQGVTQRKLALASGKSLSTVKVYWNKDADGNIYFIRPEIKPQPKKKKEKPSPPPDTHSEPPQLSPVEEESIIRFLEELPAYDGDDSSFVLPEEPMPVTDEQAIRECQESIHKIVRKVLPDGRIQRTFIYGGNLPQSPQKQEPKERLPTEEELLCFVAQIEEEERIESELEQKKAELENAKQQTAPAQITEEELAALGDISDEEFDEWFEKELEAKKPKPSPPNEDYYSTWGKDPYLESDERESDDDYVEEFSDKEFDGEGEQDAGGGW